MCWWCILLIVGFIVLGVIGAAWSSGPANYDDEDFNGL